MPEREIQPSQPSVLEVIVEQSPVAVPAQALAQPIKVLPTNWAFCEEVPPPVGKSESPPNFIQPIFDDQA